MNIVNENHRYSVPMSLWLVVVTQRMMPAGGGHVRSRGRGRRRRLSWGTLLIRVLSCLRRLLSRAGLYCAYRRLDDAAALLPQLLRV
jgi:hypothetical protein